MDQQTGISFTHGPVAARVFENVESPHRPSPSPPPPPPSPPSQNPYRAMVMDQENAAGFAYSPVAMDGSESFRIPRRPLPSPLSPQSQIWFGAMALDKSKNIQFTYSSVSAGSLDDIGQPRRWSPSAPPSHKSSQADEIPDGGLQAWLQVLGAFFLWWNSMGLVNSYGAWGSYYKEDLLKTRPPSDAAWPGSIQSCLVLLVGAFTGPMYDAGHFQTLLFIGSALVVTGMYMNSMSTQYWQIILAQGIVSGVGGGCLFTPAVAHISTYFSTMVPIASGLAALGSGMGGTILPIVFHQLEPKIGFAWTTRIIALINLATLTIPMAIMKTRKAPAKRRQFIDLSAWKDPAYDLWIAGTFVAYLGALTPYMYAALYAVNVGAASEATAMSLVSILAAGSVIGRIGPSILALKVGMFNVVIACTIMTGAIGFAFMGPKSLGGFAVVGVLYGFFSGGMVSILPSLVVLLSPNRAAIGTRMGMGFGVVSLAALLGTPIGGFILDRYGYAVAFSFSGVCAIISAVILAGARGWHGGWKFMKKL